MFSEFTQYGQEIYVGVVLFIGCVTLFRVLRLLRVSATFRRKRLRKRQQLDAVHTDSPVDNPTSFAAMKGLESIERSASVSRRVLVPLILATTLAFVALPFLARAPATMVSIIVAVGTVVLGVAARPLIENAISGLVMTFSRLINIGDTVRVEGLYGTIEDISTTHTTIKVWDWRRFVVPNSKMLQQSFFNYSVHDKYEWTCVAFTVSYETPIDVVRELVLPIPKESASFANHEEPQFWVMEVSPQGYEVWLAAWADTPSHAWTLRADMREGIVRCLQREGIPLHQMRHEVVTREAPLQRVQAAN